jgi:hypothetical protein
LCTFKGIVEEIAQSTQQGLERLKDAFSQVSYMNANLNSEQYNYVFLLKVPRCEIFDCSDFPEFYTIKSLRVGDFGVKIKNLLKNI